MQFVYLRVRRLVPLIVGHWLMDLASVLFMVSWLHDPLTHSEENTKMKAVSLPFAVGPSVLMIGLLAVTVLVIALTGWLPIDPILSLLISALILVSSIRLLRETLNLILEGVPSNIDLEEVGRAMAGSAAGVRSVHDLHIWAVSSNHVMLSAHVIIDDLSQWPSIHKGMERLLHDRYEITHVTLQPVAVPESVALDSILGR